jgi:hypothetical protein
MGLADVHTEHQAGLPAIIWQAWENITFVLRDLFCV